MSDVYLCNICKHEVVKKIVPPSHQPLWYHCEEGSEICEKALPIPFANAESAAIVQLKALRKDLDDLLLDQDGNLKTGTELRKAQAEQRRQARNLSAKIWRRNPKNHKHFKGGSRGHLPNALV